MTAISSSISMGRQMMDARISQATANGSISSTDQAALETALDTIGKSVTAAGSASTPPTDIESEVGSLIQQQVSSGTLTSDQAAELQTMFSQGAQGAPATPDLSSDTDATSLAATQGASVPEASHGVHGHHHHGGGGGALAFLDSTGDTTNTAGLIGNSAASSTDDIADTDDTDDTSVSASSTSPSSTATASLTPKATEKQIDTLITFLQNLRSSFSNDTYGATSATVLSNRGVIVNATA